MKSPCLSRPVVASGWVRRAEATDWGRMYTFRVIDWERLQSQIPPGLSALFHQRNDRRVLLDSDRPVELRIGGLPPLSWEQVFLAPEPSGTLLDLSPRGLSFRADPATGRQIDRCRSLEVSFTLPEASEELSFWIQILTCITASEGFYYSALFDEARTRNFGDEHEKLVSALEGDFSSHFRVADTRAGPVASDCVRIWAEN